MSGNSPANPKDAFPDLYRLLRIANPISATETQIGQAIETLRRTVSQNADPNSVAFRRATRVLDLATKHLLDPTRKAAYDFKWKQVYGTSSAATPTKAIATTPAAASMANGSQAGISTAGDTEDQLNTLFPLGDPDEPFNLSAFRNLSKVEFQNDEAEYHALLDFLNSSPRNRLTEQPSSFSMPGTRGGTRPSTSRRVTKRNRTHRSPWLGLLAIACGIAVVFALGAYLLQSPQQTTNQLQTADASATSSSRVSTNTPTVPGAERRSGLPAPGAGEPGDLVPDFPSNTPAAVEPALAITPPATPDSGTPKSIETSKPNEDLKPTETKTNAPNSNLKTTEAPTSEPGTKTTSVASSSKVPSQNVAMVNERLTDDQREAWTRAMLAVRVQIGKQEFGDAESKLTDLQGKAKLPAQLEQHTRLKTILTLVREFHQAMLAGVAGLRAAETITVGSSTVVSFVSSNATSVTFHVSSLNKKYSYSAIPIGLAYALADLKLDRAHPNTLARKAAFALVHPLTNNEALERAKKMMLEAAQANAIPADMILAFEDNFELQP